MNFIADENFPFSCVRQLREAGHDVLFIAHDSPGILDESIVELAANTHRIILTSDRDFASLIFKAGKTPAAGVVYFRLDAGRIADAAAILLELMGNSAFSFQGKITVVKEDNVRQRLFVG